MQKSVQEKYNTRVKRRKLKEFSTFCHEKNISAKYFLFRPGPCWKSIHKVLLIEPFSKPVDRDHRIKGKLLLTPCCRNWYNGVTVWNTWKCSRSFLQPPYPMGWNTTAFCLCLFTILKARSSDGAWSYSLHSNYAILKKLPKLLWGVHSQLERAEKKEHTYFSHDLNSLHVSS